MVKKQKSALNLHIITDHELPTCQHTSTYLCIDLVKTLSDTALQRVRNKLSEGRKYWQ